MRSLVRIRIVLARRPWIVWLATGSVSLAAGSAVVARLGDVQATRDAWGTRRSVWVVTAPILPGSPLDTAPIERRALPVAAVPREAVEALPAGGTVVRELVAGEILVPADIGAGDPRFVLAPPGSVLVAVAPPDVVVPLAAGDRVGVSTGGIDDSVHEVDAVVVGVDSDRVVLALDPADAAAVALAAADPSRRPGLVLVSTGAGAAGRGDPTS